MPFVGTRERIFANQLNRSVLDKVAPCLKVLAQKFVFRKSTAYFRNITGRRILTLVVVSVRIIKCGIPQPHIKSFAVHTRNKALDVPLRCLSEHGHRVVCIADHHRFEQLFDCNPVIWLQPYHSSLCAADGLRRIQLCVKAVFPRFNVLSYEQQSHKLAQISAMQGRISIFTCEDCTRCFLDKYIRLCRISRFISGKSYKRDKRSEHQNCSK